jgi:hypothetical protein
MNAALFAWSQTAQAGAAKGAAFTPFPIDARQWREPRGDQRLLQVAVVRPPPLCY